MIDMNDKEKLFHAIVERVAKCCSYVMKDGRQSITAADILGRKRTENVSMSRCIAVSLLVSAGFTISSCALMMHRSPPAIRHMMKLDRQLNETSMVYRIAVRQSRATEGKDKREEEESQQEDKTEC